MEFQGSPEASDVAARVCAWAEHLERQGRPDDARRVLLEALDHPGELVPIRLALAKLEARSGATARSVELLRKVLGVDPGDLAAACMLAKTLVREGKPSEAEKVITEAVANGSDPSEFAEFVGELRMAQGKYAEAVAAFGPRGSLSRRGRQLRRRSWWRSGGPIRIRSGHRTSLRPVVSADSSSGMPDPPDAVLEVIAWASWLNDQGRRVDARRVVSDAFTTHGRHPQLLACAAEIEDDDGAQNTALYLWQEAYWAAPHDVDVVCGLAMCLAYTHVSPSRTFRVADAIRVLDDFPDPSNPKIRTCRANVLISNDASAARAVAAYGPVDGLPSDAARIRRRLLWRSMGPVGQMAVRFSDRLRAQRPVYPGLDDVRRAEPKSEAIAQVLDSISGLSSSDAKECIEDAWRQYGREPSLLLAFVDIDVSDGATWHGLALAEEAALSSPDNLDAVCHLAWRLASTYGYGLGLQVLQGLPDAARETVEARVVEGDLHRLAENFSLAVAAYGDPSDLDRVDRSNRRRCACRALLNRLRSTPRGDVDVLDPASLDPIPHPIAEILDRSFLINELAQARELISGALDEHSRHPLLLLRLAEIENDEGDRHACAALAREAIRSAPENPLVGADGILKLWLADYDADALRVIADLPESIKGFSLVRLIAGYIYRYWNLPGNVVTAFERSGLNALDWRSRRTCWWRSGGPVAQIRSSLLALESALLSGLALPERQAAALSTLALPSATEDAVRADLAAYRMVISYLKTFRPGVVGDWLGRTFGPGSTVIVFTAMAVVERFRWPMYTLAHSIIVAALATAAEAVALWILGNRTSRWGTRVAVAVVSGGGAAFVLRFPGQLTFGAGLTLLAFAAVIVTAFLLFQVLRFIPGIRTARRQRKEAEICVLGALLDLLGEFITPQQRRTASTTRGWMADLESIAVIFERDLPHALRTGDPDSQSSIAAYARSASATLREMKQVIAWPNQASWQELIERLTGLAVALAHNDFKDWPGPLPEVAVPQPARSLWRKAMDTVRTTLVILAPPLVTFLLPLAVPLSGPGLSWLRLATIVWALLGTVIALDPAWAERITKMRQGLDLLRKATPPLSADGHPVRNGPDDVATQVPALSGDKPPTRHAYARHGTGGSAFL